MKELIKYIAQALVDNPDKVEVTEVIREKTCVIELRVAKEDLRELSGSKGERHYPSEPF